MTDARILGGYNRGLNKDVSGVYRGWPHYQGIDIYLHDGILAGYWYDWTSFGDPAYYMFTCNADEEQFTIKTTKGGTFYNPTCTEHDIGIGSLDLVDGYFRWNTNEHGRGSYELGVGAISTDPRNGIYYDPRKPGAGFGVKYWGNRVSMYWFNWRQTEVQQWWLAVGEPDDMHIYEYSRGEHMFAGGLERSVGKATFDGEAFRYTITSPFISTTGREYVTKLF